MKPSAWLFAAAMSAAGLAAAQAPQSSGVTETTDPAKIAAIEQRAQELASRPAAATANEGDQMKHKGMRHHKNKAMHKGMHKGMKKDTSQDKSQDKPPSETPMATYSTS